MHISFGGKAKGGKLATVKSALRNAWKKFDGELRREYARRVYGVPDNKLPNDELTKYVFPAIFTVEGCVYKESRWVNNANKWEYDLQNPFAGAEIESCLLQHKKPLEELGRWKAGLRRMADQLGVSLEGKDPRTLARYAFDAELLHHQMGVLGAGVSLEARNHLTSLGPLDLLCREAAGLVAVAIKRRGEIDAVKQLARYLEVMNREPELQPLRGVLVVQQLESDARVLAHDLGIECLVVDYNASRPENPDFSEDDALTAVVVDQMGDDVRTTAQLKAALRNTEIANEVEHILKSWTRTAPISTQDEASEVRDWEQLAVVLGSVWEGKPKEEHLRMPLAWDQVVGRLEMSGFMHAWRAGKDMALCGHPVNSGERHPAVPIGGPAESRDLAPPLDRSLYRRLEGRFGSGKASERKGFPEFDVLLPDVARRSLEPFSLNDPESRAAVVIAFFALQYVYDPDEDSEGGRFIPSPFVRQLRSTIFMRLRGARRRGGQSTDSSGPSDDSTPSDPRTASVERQANALAEFQDAYMERLWTRVHNLEVDSLRQGGGKKVHDWRALRAIMLDNAFKVGGDAWATGVKPPKAVSEVAIAIGMSPGPSPLGLPIGALYSEYEATLAVIEGVGEFLTLVQDFLDLERLEAHNGGLDEDDEDDRTRVWADAATLWLEGRERLAEARSVDGLDSPDVTLEDVLPLFKRDLGNGLPEDIE